MVAKCKKHLYNIPILNNEKGQKHYAKYKTKRIH